MRKIEKGNEIVVKFRSEGLKEVTADVEKFIALMKEAKALVDELASTRIISEKSIEQTVKVQVKNNLESEYGKLTGLFRE